MLTETRTAVTVAPYRVSRLTQMSMHANEQPAKSNVNLYRSISYNFSFVCMVIESLTQ